MPVSQHWRDREEDLELKVRVGHMRPCFKNRKQKLSTLLQVEFSCDKYVCAMCWRLGGLFLLLLPETMYTCRKLLR